MPDEIEIRKPVSQQQTMKTNTKAKPLATRSRSVLGCDQVGIETLVSMLSSGGSDSEKEEPQSVQVPAPKPDTTRTRTSMLRKTGKTFASSMILMTNLILLLVLVSFQDDESLSQSHNKDPFSRRNSNVPFAGRMRNTRTLFGNEISNLYLPNRWNVEADIVWKTSMFEDLNAFIFSGKKQSHLKWRTRMTWTLRTRRKLMEMLLKRRKEGNILREIPMTRNLRIAKRQRNRFLRL